MILSLYSRYLVLCAPNKLPVYVTRVLVEFDTPGHASSWCIGYPSVCPSPTCKSPLNPASNQTFDLIESVLGECTGKTPLGGLFPETMIHLGGDEVNTACWNEVPAIAKWLTANNLTADGGWVIVLSILATHYHCG